MLAEYRDTLEDKLLLGESSSSYLGRFMVPSTHKKAIAALVRTVSLLDFDAVAFRGVSGALLAPPLAFALGKSLIVVRKPDDLRNHGGCTVEGGTQHVKRYLIVDDFVASGRTVYEIVTAIAERWPHMQYVGTATADRAREGNGLLTTDFRYRYDREAACVD